MKIRTVKLLSLLLCVILAFGAVLPAFAAGKTEVKPTWQNTVETVKPAGDAPFVKIKLTYEGYKIEECRLPQQYEIVFKDGTKQNARIGSEPSHFAPMAVYENYFDVKTPDGTITLYARVAFSGEDETDMVFSVGQYILDGSLREDGTPAPGSMVYEFPIIEEKCETEVDKSNFFVRTVYFFYSLYLRAERWFVYHFGK